MLIDTDRRTVAGVTFAGPGVVELLRSATIAVSGEVPLDRLWHAVPAFPTIREVWRGCWRPTGTRGVGRCSTGILAPHARS
jgi:pyruvate/2-oxoglutarate dehydrogenase complex dihydrolipoamide dehydrogenase (E3) component